MKFNLPRKNEQIHAPQVRLIDENGLQIGIKPLFEAIRIAREKDMDLVEVSGQANPPVCKIVRYDKYCYELEKKLKMQRKQKIVHLKNIQIRPRISQNDLNIKIKHIEEIINDKDQVKVTVIFFGRESEHIEVGKQIMDYILEKLNTKAKVIQPLRYEGNRMWLLLGPH